jgi:fimbrial chaperone protein
MRAASALAALAGGLAFASAPAAAQSIGIAPVGITLASGEMTTTLRVTNRDSVATAVQVRPFLWDQAGAEDGLTATHMLLVSPPIAHIAPGQTQIVRLLLKAPAGATEASYRLLIDQIPTEPTANGVRIALRISVPVFALPAVPVHSKLSWQALAAAPRTADLVVANSGGRHIRMNAIHVFAGASELRLDSPANLYLLPGSQRRLHLSALGDALKPGTTLRVSASSDEGDIVASPILQPTP